MRANLLFPCFQKVSIRFSCESFGTEVPLLFYPSRAASAGRQIESRPIEMGESVA